VQAAALQYSMISGCDLCQSGYYHTHSLHRNKNVLTNYTISSARTSWAKWFL